MKKKLPLLALLFIVQIFPQVGIIKGIVIDKQSENPLEGATIELRSHEIKLGAITNIDGQFIMTNVPIGRQTIVVSFIGYESITIPNIEVNTAKDKVVSVQLMEAFNSLEEVVVTNTINKDGPRNELATVSARQFSLEEVTRFSGGRGDIGRLAANYAGVSTPNDSRNDIVVRGNSPTGMLWRLEGIPIPNPNHYSAFGTTGGPVSVVNSNVLQNSDFLTSAFPAEYGNAIGGVFDLGLRTGNVDNYEFTAQVGAFTGLEAAAEGPLGENKGSFLVAARYSLISLIRGGAGGASEATPNYADVAFNFNLGKSKLGTFSVFGLLGTSDIDFLDEEIDEDDLFASEGGDLFVESRFGVVGIKHRMVLGSNAYLKTVVAGSLAQNEVIDNRFFGTDTPMERTLLFSEVDDSETRYSFSTTFNSKLSNKVTLRAGILLENFILESLLRTRDEQDDLNGDGDRDLNTFRDTDERFALVQPYVQSQFRLTKSLTFNAGLQGIYSALNNQFELEPRAALNLGLSNAQGLNFGYGLHHQNVPLPLLFLQEDLDGVPVQSNRELNFVRSHHFVLGYEVKLAARWRGKLEAYYQDISNVAVESSSSSYSTLTEGADFEFDYDRIPLVNSGTGFNRGVELTLEKFLGKGYYGLLTASFFESKYQGSDGVERNTPFNNGYVVNFLTGREFPLGGSNRAKLFFDTRIVRAGGRYFTPVDLVASEQAGIEILQEDSAFSEQYDAYFRWDMKFGVKLNGKVKKRFHQFYLDLQNVTNRDNVFIQRFNPSTNALEQVNQIGFFPDFGYKFQF